MEHADGLDVELEVAVLRDRAVVVDRRDLGTEECWQQNPYPSLCELHCEVRVRVDICRYLDGGGEHAEQDGGEGEVVDNVEEVALAHERRLLQRLRARVNRKHVSGCFSDCGRE